MDDSRENEALKDAIREALLNIDSIAEEVARVRRRLRERLETLDEYEA